jgi:hypothetical protein
MRIGLAGGDARRRSCLLFGSCPPKTGPRLGLLSDIGRGRTGVPRLGARFCRPAGWGMRQDAARVQSGRPFRPARRPSIMNNGRQDGGGPTFARSRMRSARRNGRPRAGSRQTNKSYRARRNRAPAIIYCRARPSSGRTFCDMGASRGAVKAAASAGPLCLGSVRLFVADNLRRSCVHVMICPRPLAKWARQPRPRVCRRAGVVVAAAAAAWSSSERSQLRRQSMSDP